MARCKYLVYGKTGLTISGILGKGEAAYCTALGNKGVKEPIPGSTGKTGVRMKTLQRKDEYCYREDTADKTCIHRNANRINSF